MKRFSTIAILSALTVVSIYGRAGVETEEPAWRPVKPITIIAPPEPGGVADQAVRILAGVLEESLDQRFFVQSSPGVSGPARSAEAFEAIHDGYTWASGAAVDLGGYKVLGLLDTSWDDWSLFLTVAHVPVVAVHPAAPYETFGDLLEAMKTEPGSIQVATGGDFSAGRISMETISELTGVEYKGVPFEDVHGAAAAVSSGGAEVVAGLAAEVADMLTGEKLRALAVLDDEPLVLEGYGEIPPVTEWFDGYEPAPLYLGVWVPADIPPDIRDTLEEVWSTAVAGSDTLSSFAASRGLVFDPCSGEEAKKRALRFVRLITWRYYDADAAAISPEEIGITRP